MEVRLHVVVAVVVVVVVVGIETPAEVRSFLALFASVVAVERGDTPSPGHAETVLRPTDLSLGPSRPASAMATFCDSSDPAVLSAVTGAKADHFQWRRRQRQQQQRRRR